MDGHTHTHIFNIPVGLKSQWDQMGLSTTFMGLQEACGALPGGAFPPLLLGTFSIQIFLFEDTLCRGYMSYVIKDSLSLIEL